MSRYSKSHTATAEPSKPSRFSRTDIYGLDAVPSTNEASRFPFSLGILCVSIDDGILAQEDPEHSHWGDFCRWVSENLARVFLVLAGTVMANVAIGVLAYAVSSDRAPITTLLPFLLVASALALAGNLTLCYVAGCLILKDLLACGCPRMTINAFLFLIKSRLSAAATTLLVMGTFGWMLANVTHSGNWIWFFGTITTGLLTLATVIWLMYAILYNCIESRNEIARAVGQTKQPPPTYLNIV